MICDSRMEKEMRRFLNECSRLLPKLAPLVYWLLSVAAIVVLALYLLSPWSLSDRIRWAGIFFELLGILMVVFGLSEARRQFGERGLFSYLLNTVAEFRYLFVKRPRNVITARGELKSGSAVFAAAIRVGGGSLEDRVKTLEDISSNIEKRLGEQEGNQQQLRDDLESKLRAEVSEREKAVDSVRQKLKEITIGDHHLELLGLFYLILGVFFANAPEGSSERVRDLFLSFGVTL